jgi:thiol-disulfide isomerase/thioredoxin
MDKKRMVRIAIYTAVLLIGFFLIKRNKTAPEIEFSSLQFTNLEEEQSVISDFYGAPVLLNFWQTWCGPCIKELPLLNNMVENWDGLTIIVVTHEDFNKWEKYVDLYPNLQFVQMQQTMEEFGVSNFPTTYLLNNFGETVYSKVGMRDWDSSATILELKNKLN